MQGAITAGALISHRYYFFDDTMAQKWWGLTRLSATTLSTCCHVVWGGEEVMQEVNLLSSRKSHQMAPTPSLSLPSASCSIFASASGVWWTRMKEFVRKACSLVALIRGPGKASETCRAEKGRLSGDLRPFSWGSLMESCNTDTDTQGTTRLSALGVPWCFSLWELTFLQLLLELSAALVLN